MLGKCSIRSFRKCMFLTITYNSQAVKTVGRLSSVRLGGLSSEKQDTYRQLLTESWTLLKFKMISVSSEVVFQIELILLPMQTWTNSEGNFGSFYFRFESS